MELLEAARWAPSALNTQPWEFIAITDPQVRAAVCDHARVMGLRWPHIAQAPLLIVFCAPPMTPYTRDDLLLAGANLMLAATDRGLGTCWIGGFNPETIRRLLGIPHGFMVAGMCTVGYPEGETPAPPKRPLQDMVHWETYAGGRGGLGKLTGPLEVLGRLIRLQLRRRPPARVCEEKTPCD